MERYSQATRLIRMIRMPGAGRAAETEEQTQAVLDMGTEVGRLALQLVRRPWSVANNDRTSDALKVLCTPCRQRQVRRTGS